MSRNQPQPDDETSLEAQIDQLETELDMSTSETVEETGRRMASLRD